MRCQVDGKHLKHETRLTSLIITKPLHVIRYNEDHIPLYFWIPLRVLQNDHQVRVNETQMNCTAATRWTYCDDLFTALEIRLKIHKYLNSYAVTNKNTQTQIDKFNSSYIYDCYQQRTHGLENK